MTPSRHGLNPATLVAYVFTLLVWSGAAAYADSLSAVAGPTEYAPPQLVEPRLFRSAQHGFWFNYPPGWGAAEQVSDLLPGEGVVAVTSAAASILLRVQPFPLDQGQLAERGESFARNGLSVRRTQLPSGAVEHRFASGVNLYVVSGDPALQDWLLRHLRWVAGS